MCVPDSWGKTHLIDAVLALMFVLGCISSCNVLAAHFDILGV